MADPVNNAYGIGPNPLYTTTDATPPGLSAIPYMIGKLGSNFTGGVARPYVPVNMSTYDAQIANRVIGPMTGKFGQAVYGQFGEQMMNTLGATPLIPAIAERTGYSAEQMRRDMAAGGNAFMRSMIGQAIAPMADNLLNQAGITGGSIVASMNAVNAGRLNLLGPGQYYNPLNAGQMHASMGAASAMMMLTNGLLSQRGEDGKLSVLANTAMTQGLNRELITSAIMAGAGRGLFTSNAEGTFAGNRHYAGGFQQQMQAAAGKYSLGELSYDDLTGTGSEMKVGKKEAAQLKEASRDVAAKVKGVADALGAMRDLTGSVENAFADLDELTNGSWLKDANSLSHARDAAFKVKAIAQTYNIDPNQAIGMIRANRYVMQSAAGVTDHMRAIGLDGGGMFGLAAQSVVLQDIEDKITASGARGDPRAEARIRYQGANAVARSMNTSAGRASQLLAYARQTGVFNDEQAERFRAGLMSGDRSMMDESLNKMLVTMFGSAEAGRRMMDDRQFMQAIRAGLSDKYGAYANQMLIQGAASEMSNQELQASAKQRLEYSNRALSLLGRETRQTSAGVGSIVNAVDAAFRDTAAKSGDADIARYGGLFREQVAQLQKQGYSADAALRATISAFKDDPNTSRFASLISENVNRAAADNNEAIFNGADSKDAAQAFALLKSMQRWKDIDSTQASEVSKMLRSGRGAEALARLSGIMGGLSGDRKNHYSGVLDNAKKDYDRNQAAMAENREVEQLIYAGITRAGVGSEGVADSLSKANEAATAYFRDIHSGDEDVRASAKNRFWEAFSKSKLGTIFGDKNQQDYLDAVERGDVDYIKKMGRIALRAKQNASTVMGSNGWDLTYTGFFNSGFYAGNSEEARKARDAVVNQVASNISEDAIRSADDRSTFAQDLVGFLTGTKNIRGLLKLHDSGDALSSRVSRYLDKNDKFTEAQDAQEKTSGEYSAALNRLVKEGRGTDKDLIDQILKDNPEITEDNIRHISESLDGFSGRDDIVAHLEARRNAQVLQGEAQRELGSIGKDAGVVDAYRQFSARRNAADSRLKRAQGRASGTMSFLDSLEFDSDSILGFDKKLSSAYSAMMGAVSDDEMLKKAKESGYTSLDGLSVQDRSELARSVLKEKVAAGDSAAMDVVKKYSAAAKSQPGRITGELTIRNGNEQSTAVLEANIGGGLS